MIFLFNWMFFRFHVNFQGCFHLPSTDGEIFQGILIFLGSANSLNISKAVGF